MSAIPNLFGGPVRNQGSSGPAASTGPVHLVEMRCGRMNLRDGMVTPDRRKGLLYVIQSDDGLAHFCWKDRTSGTVEEDLIIFPDDISFEKLSTEKTRGGRVYLLRFRSNPARKFFFWSQEPRTDNDDTISEKIMEAVNNPMDVLARVMASRGEGATSSRGGAEGLFPPGMSPLSGNLSESDLSALLGAYSPQQLISLLGGNSRPGSGATPFGVSAAGAGLASNNTAPAATTNTTSQAAAPTSQPPATPASTGANSNAAVPRRPGAADLAAALRQIGAMAQGKSSGGAASGAASVPLSDILAADAVINSTAGAATDRLLAGLPNTGLPEDQELIASLRSPQFQQAANMLSAALETGQLGPLLIEMGVPASAANNVHDMESFLRLLQQHNSAPATPATNGSANGAPKAPAAPKKENNGATADGSKSKDGANGNDNGSSPMEH